MIRCYKYRAWPASRADADALHGQARLGGDYRRALVEIENRQRALLRSIWAEPMRPVAPDDREDWRANGGDAKIKAWTKTDEYRSWRTRIQAAARAASKAAYSAAGERGLAWGTRLAVGESVDHATRTTRWGDDLGHAPSNRVAVQIQGSTDPERLLDDAHRATLLPCAQLVGGDDKRLRIGADLYALGERVDGYQIRAVGEARNRGGRVRPARLRQASIRVGSEGRAPVWAHLHVLMHRPLPDGGYVKGAWAQRRQVGGRWEWELVLSIDMVGRAAPQHDRSTETVAIDLGWRRRDDGMRVAYWAGSDGAEGETVIPVEVERRKGKSDDLRSIRDNRRNLLVARLRTWVEARRGTWLDQALAHAHQWTRTGHFVRLERTWRDARVDGDTEIYAALVEHLRKDRHLHAWQVHGLVRMQRQIRGRLDAWAHELCARYGVVVLERLDLRAMKEDDDPARIASRTIQRLAPGEVIRAVKQAASKYGAIVHELDPADSTRSCAQCGVLRTVADQRKLVLECDACGYAEDQDRTAARNLLRASELVRDEDGRPLDAGVTRGSAKKLAPRRTRKRKVDGGARSGVVMLLS